ncbi:MAG: hypothetical protein K6B42_09280 [Clostridia bacterium]|nr:hypothetical protein [Clostridia bacterium]
MGANTMRTNEERIAAMHARAAELNRTQRARKVRIMQVSGALFACAATIMLAIFIPHIEDYEQVPYSESTGSVFADSGSLGYIVVAIIAFLLGTALTMFCYRLREWRDRKDKEEF